MYKYVVIWIYKLYLCNILVCIYMYTNQAVNVQKNQLKKIENGEEQARN